MVRTLTLTVAALAACGVLFVSAWTLKAQDAPKYTIKEVMKKANTPPKSSLFKKVVGDTATADEKKLLVELYEAMAQQSPPKGDEEHWKKLNTALLQAAKDVAAGKEGAREKLMTAGDCGTCHKSHKG